MKKKNKKNKNKVNFHKSVPDFGNQPLMEKKKEESKHVCNSLTCQKIRSSNFYFFQTASVVKININIPGIENLSKSNIKMKFLKKSLEFGVFDLFGCTYHFDISTLSHYIIPGKSKYLIKKDKVVLELAKEKPWSWKTLEELVSKSDWVTRFHNYLQDIRGFGNEQTLVEFAMEIWDEVLKFEEMNFNYMKLPAKVQELIPQLRRTSFKSLEEAIQFIKSVLKKYGSDDEILFIVFGAAILRKMKEDSIAEQTKKKETIDEAPVQLPSNETKQEVSKPSKVSTTPEELKAEIKKTEGNTYYKKEMFYAALQLYIEAIGLCPSNPYYYSNASASYMMLGLYNEALSMAQKAVKIDPVFYKGHLRIAKCNISLGLAKAALKALTKAKEIKDCDKEEIDAEFIRLEKFESLVEKGNQMFNGQNYSLASSIFESACDIANASSLFRLLKAESYILSGNITKAKSLAESLLEENKADAHCIRGMIAYYQDIKEEAFHELRAALEINKSHYKSQKLMETAKELYTTKEEGNKFFKKGKYEQALNCYRTALKVDVKNSVVSSKIHFNVALLYAKQMRIDDAIQTLTVAIGVKNDYVKAYLKRASLYQQKNDLNSAIDDLKKAVKLDPNPENKKALQDAQDQKKKKIVDKRKDYYKIMGLTPLATTSEIKDAYKKLALRHHPDKHGDKNEKEVNEKIFKDISEAYSVLKDPKTKDRYDRGLDTEVQDGLSEDLMTYFMFQAAFRRMSLFHPFNYCHY